jgi:uncharacterized protein YdaU (DUF1376 family)
MHYYKRNIGDYAKKCGRLSMLQHGAYTLLIDACYDREVFPTLRDAIDWTWASSKEEVEAVEFVLNRFFTVEDGVHTQKRIADELAQYHETGLTNQRIALEREAKRKGKPTDRARSVDGASPGVNEAPPNHKPLTNNHKPDIQKVSPPEGVSMQVWADFLKYRKALKAPITDTAIAGFIREAAKAGVTLEQAFVITIENNWRGFKADWLKDKAPTSNIMRGVL